MNYYNENDPKAAAWLRELIARRLIPDGVVDERSITEVTPGVLRGHHQCHFFAGIGGWSYALQLAGWPADRPVWTGSCPCQPFSVAGKGKGTDDERHLWPVFAQLIRQCQPPTVFGEQVASAAGRAWLAGVFADLEGMGYHRSGADLCAAGIGAPHIRQRLYWLAHANSGRDIGSLSQSDFRPISPANGKDGTSERLAHMQHSGWHGRAGQIGQADGRGQPADGSDDDRRLGIPHGHGSQPGSVSAAPSRHRHPIDPAGFWDDAQVAACRDGKTRRISTEPAFFPLAHGVPARLVRLRGYGNAIVPQVAAAFVSAFLDLQPSQP